MFNSIPNFSKNAPTTNRLPPLHAAEATLEYFDESEWVGSAGDGPLTLDAQKTWMP